MRKFQGLYLSLALAIEEFCCICCFRVSNWVDDLEKTGYDPAIPPAFLYGNATDVQIQFYVESLGNFRILSMDFELDIYFIEHWVDERLAFHDDFSCIQLNRWEQIDRLWHPDVYFANSKDAEYNRVTIPNQIFRICPGGRVRFSVRISVIVSCYMDLRAYPLDKQICHLKILPYGNNITRLRLQWTETDPIMTHPNMTETDLRLVKSKPEHCNGDYYGETYSCLMGRFYLERSLGQYLLRVYAPTFSIVVISWISFWIDPRSIPGRSGLAVTTLLTLATQATGISYQLPPVGYAKGLDVWLSVCLLFLFGALIEFAVVNTYFRRAISASQKENYSVKVPLLHLLPTPMPASEQAEEILYRPHLRSRKRFPLLSMSEEGRETVKQQTYLHFKNRAKNVDRLSRILFPSFFFTFVIAYWCVYKLYWD